MSPLLTDRLVIRQINEWIEMTKIPRANKKNPPVITISREWGSEGSGIAREIQRKLGEPWKIWDKQIIDEIAKKTDVRKEFIESLDERVHTEFEKFLGGFYQRREISLD